MAKTSEPDHASNQSLESDFLEEFLSPIYQDSN